MSMQSLDRASAVFNRLGSWGCQLEKVKEAFEWSHTYVPSMSRSFKPVQAVQFQISEEQFTEIKRVYKNKLILLFYLVFDLKDSFVLFKINTITYYPLKYWLENREILYLFISLV